MGKKSRRKKHNHTNTANAASAIPVSPPMLPPLAPPDNTASAGPSSSSSAVSSVSQPVLVREECPICFITLPFERNECNYRSCCGQTICYGCTVGDVRGRVEPPLPPLIPFIEGTHDDDREEREEHEFYEILKRWATLDGTGSLCPYCRTGIASDNQEELRRLRNRIDHFNDIHAIIKLGLAHMDGDLGLPQSRTEAETLLKIAYDHGSAEAVSYLAVFHADTIGDNYDEIKMIELSEEAARRGHMSTAYNWGTQMLRDGNFESAVRYLMMAARSGLDRPMFDRLLPCLMMGLISQEDFDTTMRIHHATRNEINTERRKYATRYRIRVNRNTQP
mmetsp:Transcript_10947/g.11741  ORF Transcript_10947/g.11741 Transcript_10947/m.11741 type:complete len:334 (+) Transcript_10947:181-1182(+)